MKIKDKIEFWELQRSLGFEFSRYILAHPEFAERIPLNALIVFQLKDNPGFNEWVIRIAKAHKEPDQPAIIIEVEKLLPPLESRLVNPTLQETLHI